MTVRLITLSLRLVLRLLLLTCRSSRSKDLELLVLRQELAVLGRQVPHPKTKREERLVLTVLQRLRPVHERLSNLFTPDTLRRWDREFVRRKWDGAERIIVLSIWHENRCTASFRLPVQDAGKMIAAIAGRDDSGDQPAKQ